MADIMVGLILFCIALGFYTGSIAIPFMVFGGVLFVLGLINWIVTGK